MSRTALVKNPFAQEPFGVMRRLSDEMDRLFEGFSMPRALTPTREEPWAPGIETFARDGTFVVRADLPGLSEKDVSVEVAGQLLTLKGERRQEKEDRHPDHYRCEVSYGSFARVVELPEGAQTSAATATFKNGVLEVVMPMPAPKAPEARKLEVAAG